MKKIILPFFCMAAMGLSAQQPATTEKINDSNTPLHLMKPDYKTPYGVVKQQDVKAAMDRVLVFLEKATPTRVINKDTKEEITDLKKIDKNALLERGQFRLASYEWGVTYAGMLLAAETSGDVRYSKYVPTAFCF